MRAKLQVLAILVSFSVVADASLRNRQLAAERLLRDRKHNEACAAFMGLAKDPGNVGSRSAYDFRKSLELLRNLNRINELDFFKASVFKVHADNVYVVEALAMDYASDPNHWGYTLNGRFFRGTVRYGNAQAVTCFERDHAMAIGLMVRAAMLAKKKGGKEYGRLCLEAARLILYENGVRRPERLARLTDLEAKPPFELGHDARYRIGGRGREGHALERLELPGLPASLEDSTTDGERWRYLMAEADKSGYARVAALELADYLRQVAGVRQLRSVPYVSSDRLAKACRTLTDDETLTVLGGIVSRVPLADSVNFVKMYRTHNAMDKLAEVYADRGQWQKLSALKLPPSIEETLVNGYGFEGHSSGPVSTAMLLLNYRRPAKVTLSVTEVDMDKMWQDTIAYLSSSPGHLSRERASFANLGDRASRHRATFLKQPKTESIDLPELIAGGVGSVDVSRTLQRKGAYLVEGRTATGYGFSTVRHLTNVGIVLKPLVSGAWVQVIRLSDGTPIPDAVVQLVGYRPTYSEGRFSLGYRRLERKTDVDGQVVLTEKEMVDEGGEAFKWALYVKVVEGIAFLDFALLPGANPMESPTNAWRTQLTMDRETYAPGDVVRYHGRVIYLGYAEQERLALKNESFKLIINDPNKRRAFTTTHKTDDAGAFEGSYALPENASEGRYYAYVPEANATVPFDVVKPARVIPRLEMSTEGRVSPGGTATCAVEVHYHRPIAAPLAVDLTVDLDLGGRVFRLKERTFSRLKSLRSSSFEWRHTVELNTKTLFELVPDREATIVIHASVGLRGKTVDRTVRIPIHHHPGRIDVVLDQPFYEVGTMVKAALRAVNHAEVGLMGNGIVVVSRSTSSGKRVEVGRIPFRTDVDGCASVEIPELGSGTFDLSVTMLPEIPRFYFKVPLIFGGGFHMPVPGLRDAPGAYSNADCVHGKGEIIMHRAGVVDDPFVSVPFRLIPQRLIGRPGNTVPTLILANHDIKALALFSRPALSYLPPKVCRFSGRSGLADVALTADDVPNMHLEAVMVTHGALQTATTEIQVERLSDAIDLVVSGPGHVQPGKEVSCRIRSRLSNAGQQLFAIVRVVEEDGNAGKIASIKSGLRPWRRIHVAHSESSLGVPAGSKTNRVLLPGFLAKDLASLQIGEDGTITADSGVNMPLVDDDYILRTIHWQRLTLSGDGEKSIVFKMPESGKDVRISAWAVGHDGALGRADHVIAGGANVLPVISVPEVMRIGDLATIKVGILAETPDLGGVDLRVSCTGGIKLEGEGTKTIRCQKGAATFGDFVLKAEKAGLAKVEVLISSAGGPFKVIKEVIVSSAVLSGKDFDHRTVALSAELSPVSLPIESDGVTWALGVAGVLQLGADARMPSRYLPLASLNQFLWSSHAKRAIGLGPEEKEDSKKTAWDALCTRGREVMLLVAGTQCRDGGWNWLGLKGGSGDPEITAWIVHGLQKMRESGHEIPRNVLFRGIQFLRGYLAEQVMRLKGTEGTAFASKEACDDLDALIYMVLVESKDRPREILEMLLRDFEKLSLPSKCRLVHVLRLIHFYEKIPPLMEHLYGLCGKNDDGSRRWVGEASVLGTAEFLLAMNVAMPGDSELIPYVDWLVEKRQSLGSWGGIRLDSRCLEALAAYAKANETIRSFGLLQLGKDGSIRQFGSKEGNWPVPTVGHWTLDKEAVPAMVKGQGRLYLSFSRERNTSNHGVEAGFDLDLRNDAVVRVGDVFKGRVTLQVPRTENRVHVKVPIPGGIRPLAAGERLHAVAPFDFGRVENGCLHLFAETAEKGQMEFSIELQGYVEGVYLMSPPSVTVDGSLKGIGKVANGVVAIAAASSSRQDHDDADDDAKKDDPP